MYRSVFTSSWLWSNQAWKANLGGVLRLRYLRYFFIVQSVERTGMVDGLARLNVHVGYDKVITGCLYIEVTSRIFTKPIDLNDCSRVVQQTGREMTEFPPVFGRGRHKNRPSRGYFCPTPYEKSSIRTKLADHLGDHVVLFPEELFC